MTGFLSRMAVKVMWYFLGEVVRASQTEPDATKRPSRPGA